MAMSPTIRASQADVTVAYSANPSSTFVSQGDLTAVFNFPSDAIDISQTDLIAVTASSNEDLQVSQADVTVVYRGRVENPSARVWTFTLDGHDFYVLRLGDQGTLVYDLFSEQWIEWASPGLPFWRLNSGINWTGAESFGTVYGSNIVVGDDLFGRLWFLNPNQPFDESPDEAREVQQPYFERVTMGQITAKARQAIPCYATWLTTDMGDPAYPGASVTLSISDDSGKTFYNAGSVEVVSGEQKPQISWYSLGQIEAPGRLFKIEDDGAVARIDSLEMNDGEG